MNYIFTCGGTGGHINPAIAIADAIKEKDKNAKILFVGNKGGMESELVRKAGYPIEFINVRGISRKLSLSNLDAVIKALNATRKCKKIFSDFQPHAVIGTGGYVCYPMLSASAGKSFTAVHESNAIPGLAVKLLKNRVDKVYVNFDECARLLGVPEKTLRTGNPQRSGIEPSERGELRKKLGITGSYRHVIVSFGGSLGAETINREMLKLMERYSLKHPEILHIHATGKPGYSDFMQEFTEIGLDKYRNIRVSEYIFDMPHWINSSDLVICRAGAMTLSELASAGRAAILIPSPNVVDNHQYKNAKAFEDAGAAFLVSEDENDLLRIPELAETLLSDRRLRTQMEQNSSKFAFRDASCVIANDIVASAHKMLRVRAN